MIPNYKLWTQLPYAGESKPPTNPEEPLAGFWPMYYFRRDAQGMILDLQGNPISLAIKNPNLINWNQELKLVQCILRNLTPHQIEIAKFWGTGVPTKQWTPIMDRLIDTYGVKPIRAGRILAAVMAGINDVSVITWFLKFRWLVARPDQLDQHLVTILCTPRHPTYPAGHATLSGVAAAILTYFFPGETHRLEEMAIEDAESRLFAGVHFLPDLNEGLRLGYQIGGIIVDILKSQRNIDGTPIDTPFTQNLHAEMGPPPYQQVIPFNFKQQCTSLVRK